MNNYLLILLNGMTILAPTTGTTVEAVLSSWGVTDPSSYGEFDSADFDPACFNFSGAFTLTAGVVGFDLAAAKTQASSTVKTQTATEQQAALEGYTPEVLASQATLPELSRTPEIQASIVEVNDLNATLQANLTAIAAATDINEVNNIVNPPTGTISTSRTGNDFNDSYYITFYSASLVEDDTELFIPGTSTVIPYILPTQFNAISEAFNTGDYLVQIRESATGLVLAEFICPEGPPAVAVPF